MSRSVRGSVTKAMIRIAPTLRAQEREYCVDAGQQQRPGVAGSGAVFGGSRWHPDPVPYLPQASGEPGVRGMVTGTGRTPLLDGRASLQLTLFEARSCGVWCGRDIALSEGRAGSRLRRGIHFGCAVRQKRV
jgi:hypothetical protein